MVVSFDSVTFSSSFKSLDHLSEKDTGTLTLGLRAVLP